jgi:hypothetical protein
MIPRLLALVALIAAPLLAHDIITTNLTYSRDISRIIERHCLSCHGPNADIPLTTYAEVRPWAVGLKEQVLSRAMPPWGAVKGFGDLSPDLALTQEDIMIVATWVIGGAPSGDPALLHTQAHGKPAASSAALADVLVVDNQAILHEPIKAAAIRPLVSIESARITAHLPDGRIQPLIWLYRFNPKLNQTFRFREPISLPAGTVLESSAPVRFTLQQIR